MKKTIYTVFDSVTGIYWHPFFAVNDEEAKRSISNAVNTVADNDLFLHPEDFTLYSIGIFNDQRDEVILEASTPMNFICRCDSLLRPAEVQK